MTYHTDQRKAMTVNAKHLDARTALTLEPGTQLIDGMQHYTVTGSERDPSGIARRNGWSVLVYVTDEEGQEFALPF